MQLSFGCKGKRVPSCRLARLTSNVPSDTEESHPPARQQARISRRLRQRLADRQAHTARIGPPVIRLAGNSRDHDRGGLALQHQLIHRDQRLAGQVGIAVAAASTAVTQRDKCGSMLSMRKD
ncbi:MAG: hypothetical protein ACRDYX_09415 [Egibacteraceae bacterium]